MMELHIYYEGDGCPCYSEIGDLKKLLRKLPKLKKWLEQAIKDQEEEN
jgi:hypothetical protein